jgi:hypothetical protein
MSTRKNKKASRPTGEVYEIVFREGGGRTLTAKALDNVLYPKALAWTRLLTSDQGRLLDKNTEAESWRKRGRETLHELAGAGLVNSRAVDDFILAAAASGVVQVELEWQGESIGWAARVFPWEQLIALATKDERLRQGDKPITVVRHLKNAGTGQAPDATATVFAVTEGAISLGYRYDAEYAAIEASLEEDVPKVVVATPGEIAEKSQSARPRRVHLVLDYSDAPTVAESADSNGANLRIAREVAALASELVVYSACYTGKRLAPLTVAQGTKYVVGFQGIVMESSLPVFFGAFYRELKRSDIMAALKAGLDANNLQPDPGELGSAVLWTAESLIAPSSPGVRAAKPAAAIAKSVVLIDENDIEAALGIDCQIEGTLNYSVLHNSTGGLFRKFRIIRLKEGKLKHPIVVSLTLDTGMDRPASCRYCLLKPFESKPQHDLAGSLILPLGSQLLRQRSETILGTVEVSIRYGGREFHHQTQSIKLLSCDEWRDDEMGRQFLPSFIFPRDPAIREIISAAQPYLRALSDDPQAAFDGYQQNSPRAVMLQARAIWSALQHTWRLDYINPPPTYTLASQRLRIPEEVLRAKRGTCIDLALLLAACWEQVGILPVIFLTSGHAFTGFWTSGVERTEFISGLENLMRHAETEKPAASAVPSVKSAAAKDLLRSVLAMPSNERTDASKRNEFRLTESWMFTEPHHLSAIRSAVEDGVLVPVEATFIPRQLPFSESLRDSAELLSQVPASHFDGMLDVQSAREKGVTPLPIFFHGIPS